MSNCYCHPGGAGGLPDLFISYTANTEFESIRPILERMLQSPWAAARQAGARQATLAALSHEAARALAEVALSGDAETRQGAAEILAHNVLSAPELSYAQSCLVRLFADTDVAVQRLAGAWTRRLEKAADSTPLLDVLEAYIESPTLVPTARGFFHCLEGASHISPALLLRAGQRFVAAVGSDAANTAGTNAFTAQTLSELVLRAYRQAENAPDLRRQCLDLFDRLLEAGSYGADKAIEAFGR